MFRFLLIGYMIVYIAVTIFASTADKKKIPYEFKTEDKPWDFLYDYILIAIGMAGMIFLLTDLQSATMKMIWRPVSIALAMTQSRCDLIQPLQG
jgi:hypothetical protein